MTKALVFPGLFVFLGMIGKRWRILVAPVYAPPFGGECAPMFATSFGLQA